MLSIIIVDDEVSTLKGISHILGRYPQEYRVTLEATSAGMALDYLAQSPEGVDVVITDVKMPVMDGVELVGILSERYPAIRTLVLSGYAEIDLVRESMKKGAVDYLLKPCRYQVLLGILQKIEEEKAGKQLLRKREDEAGRVRRAFRLAEPLPAGLLPEVHALVYCRAALNAADLEERVGRFLAEDPVLGRIRGEACLEVPLPDGDVLLLFHGSQEQGAAARLWERGYRVLRGEAVLSAMAYQRVEDSAGLIPLARSCGQLCEFLEFNGIDRPVNMEEQGKLSRLVVPSNLEEYWNRDRILPLLYMENKKSMERAVRSLCAGFVGGQGYLNPAELKNAAYKLLFGMERMVPGPPAEQGRLEDDYSFHMQQVKQARTLDALLTAVGDYIIFFNSTVTDSSQRPRYINMAVNYIRTHYMEDVLLADVAREVFLNESYFSSQFKKHMGVSFREYLNGVRLEAAKQLLSHGDLKIGQIAEMVGFGDATYFATTFKNSEGKTPKEYRKTMVIMK